MPHEVTVVTSSYPLTEWGTPQCPEDPQEGNNPAEIILDVLLDVYPQNMGAVDGHRQAVIAAAECLCSGRCLAN